MVQWIYKLIFLIKTKGARDWINSPIKVGKHVYACKTLYDEIVIGSITKCMSAYYYLGFGYTYWSEKKQQFIETSDFNEILEVLVDNIDAEQLRIIRREYSVQQNDLIWCIINDIMIEEDDREYEEE